MKQQVSSVERSGWAGALLIAGSFCIYFGLRYSLREGIWFDEALTTYFIGLDWQNLLHFISRFEANMALYYFLLKAWSSASSSELWLRLFSLLCFLAALWFIYLPLKRHFGYRAGLGFLVLCLSHFYLARYSVEIRGYALAMFLMAILWFSWTRIVLDGEQKYWLLYAATGVFAVHSHFFLALGIFCLGLMALVVVKNRSDFLKWLAVHGLIGLSFLPILAFVLFKESGQLDWIGTPSLKALIYLAFEYSGSAPQASDPVRFTLLLTLGLVTIVGMAWIVRSADRPKVGGSSQLRFWMAGLIVASAPVFIVFVISQYQPIFSTRFFITFMPFYLMLGAAGIALVFRSWSLAPIFIVMALMAMSAQAYINRESNRWAPTFSYLAEHCSQGQAVLYLSPKGQTATKFYEKNLPTGCNLVSLPFELTPENYFTKTEEYPLELKGLDSYNTVWVVKTHLSEGDKKKLASYLQQIESEVGPCVSSHGNVAIEVLRCTRADELESNKAL